MPLHAYRGFYPTVGPHVFVAEGAQVIGRVTLEENANVWFNAVLRGDVESITVGARTNVQDNSTVHAEPEHPTLIGEDVTVGHGVTIHGCTIERRVLVGINSVLLTGCQIGWGSIIGANALVPEGKAIPPRSVVLGTPGRIVRSVTDDELEAILGSARHYVQEAAIYLGDRD